MLRAHTRLKALRVKNNIVQQDMADMLDINYSTYSLKENGIRDFTITEIQKIIELFGLPYEEIFFDDNAHKSKTETA